MFDFKQSMARMSFLKARCKLYALEALAVLSGFIATATEIASLKATLGLVALGLLVYCAIKNIELYHRRLTNIAPGRDKILVWGVFILASLLTSGLAILGLFFIPAGALGVKPAVEAK